MAFRSKRTMRQRGFGRTVGATHGEIRARSAPDALPVAQRWLGMLKAGEVCPVGKGSVPLVTRRMSMPGASRRRFQGVLIAGVDMTPGYYVGAPPLAGRDRCAATRLCVGFHSPPGVSLRSTPGYSICAAPRLFVGRFRVGLLDGSTAFCRTVRIATTAAERQDVSSRGRIALDGRRHPPQTANLVRMTTAPWRASRGTLLGYLAWRRIPGTIGPVFEWRGRRQVHVFGRRFSTEHVFPPKNGPVPRL